MKRTHRKERSAGNRRSPAPSEVPPSVTCDGSYCRLANGNMKCSRSTIPIRGPDALLLSAGLFSQLLCETFDARLRRRRLGREDSLERVRDGAQSGDPCALLVVAVDRYPGCPARIGLGEHLLEGGEIFVPAAAVANILLGHFPSFPRMLEAPEK